MAAKKSTKPKFDPCEVERAYIEGGQFERWFTKITDANTTDKVIKVVTGMGDPHFVFEMAKHLGFLTDENRFDFDSYKDLMVFLITRIVEAKEANALELQRYGKVFTREEQAPTVREVAAVGAPVMRTVDDLDNKYDQYGDSVAGELMEQPLEVLQQLAKDLGNRQLARSDNMDALVDFLVAAAEERHKSTPREQRKIARKEERKAQESADALRIPKTLVDPLVDKVKSAARPSGSYKASFSHKVHVYSFIDARGNKTSAAPLGKADSGVLAFEGYSVLNKSESKDENPYLLAGVWSLATGHGGAYSSTRAKKQRGEYNSELKMEFDPPQEGVRHIQMMLVDETTDDFGIPSY